MTDAVVLIFLSNTRSRLESCGRISLQQRGDETCRTSRVAYTAKESVERCDYPADVAERPERRGLVCLVLCH